MDICSSSNPIYPWAWVSKAARFGVKSLKLGENDFNLFYIKIIILQNKTLILLIRNLVNV